MLLLLVLAVKNEGGVGCYEKGIVPKEQWNPKRLNPKGTYVGSGIKNVSNGKKRNDANFRVPYGYSFFKKRILLLSVLELKNNLKI